MVNARTSISFFLFSLFLVPVSPALNLTINHLSLNAKKFNYPFFSFSFPTRLLLNDGKVKFLSSSFIHSNSKFSGIFDKLSIRGSSAIIEEESFYGCVTFEQYSASSIVCKNCYFNVSNVLFPNSFILIRNIYDIQITNSIFQCCGNAVILGYHDSSNLSMNSCLIQSSKSRTYLFFALRKESSINANLNFTKTNFSNMENMENLNCDFQGSFIKVSDSILSDACSYYINMMDVDLKFWSFLNFSNPTPLTKQSPILELKGSGNIRGFIFATPPVDLSYCFSFQGISPHQYTISNCCFSYDKDHWIKPNSYGYSILTTFGTTYPKMIQSDECKLFDEVDYVFFGQYSEMLNIPK